jgi:hypothetical protein
MRNSHSRRGGILSTLLIVFVVLGCIAVTIGINVARSIHVHEANGKDGKDVSIGIPGGQFTIHAYPHDNFATAGLPTYPGARRRKESGGGAVFEWNSDDGKSDKGFSVAGDEMITGDSVDQVLRYYQNELPSWVVSHDEDGQITLKLTKNGEKRYVAIRHKSDGTHIGVATVGTPASN